MFPQLKEFMARDQVKKKLDQEILEMIIIENVRNAFNSATTIKHVEDYINKCFDLIKGQSVLRK